MSNLDFIAQWDIDEFKTRCVTQREFAERHPAYTKTMWRDRNYHWSVGGWGCCFMLETWGEVPLWHGSVSILEDNYQTIDCKLRLEVPRARLLPTCDWDRDHFDQARFLLAEMFGPIIRPNDNSQRAMDTTGLYGLHWTVDYDRVGHIWQQQKYLN